MGRNARERFFEALWALAEVGAAPARGKGVCTVLEGAGPKSGPVGLWVAQGWRWELRLARTAELRDLGAIYGTLLNHPKRSPDL